jgi:hypothetical protein
LQITLEEVEVVFGSGAGARVKQAMCRRRESIEEMDVITLTGTSEDEVLPDQAVTLNHVPKFANKRIRVDTPELKDLWV